LSQNGISNLYDSDCRDKIRHGFLRRVMNPAFGPKSLQAMEVTVIPYCHRLLNCIDKQIEENGEIVDMSQWFYNLSFDVHSYTEAYCLR
jgi:cytochrome P450